MQKIYEEKKKNDEALKLCLRRRVQVARPTTPCQLYAQAASHIAPSFQISKVTKVQVVPQSLRVPKNPSSQLLQARLQTAPPLPLCLGGIRSDRPDCHPSREQQAQVAPFTVHFLHSKLSSRESGEGHVPHNVQALI